MKKKSKSFPGYVYAISIVSALGILISFLGTSCSKVMLKDAVPTVLSTLPINNSTNVAVSSNPEITFNKTLDATTISSATFLIKDGSTSIPGSVNYSGKSAIFVPTTPLSENKLYSCTFTTSSKDGAGNPINVNYSWNFTTGGSGAVDNTPSVVTSVLPVENATSIGVSSPISITFSESVNPTTLNSSSVTLKQGSTTISGTLTLSGTTATFTPSSALSQGMMYTVSISGVKDMAGNAMASAKTWTFTTSQTADTTAPTVSSVLPAANATAVAVNSTISVTFNEAMAASTFSTSTFTVKQGSTAVPGTVAYSGSTATFTPSSALAPGAVYTASIGGAKDVAGNMMSSPMTWSFTTATAQACGSGTQLFSTMVFPIIQNKCMPCHSGSKPSGGISLTNYTQVSAIGSKLDNPTMYGKMGVTTCEQATIKAWLAQGSLNN